MKELRIHSFTGEDSQITAQEKAEVAKSFAIRTARLFDKHQDFIERTPDKTEGINLNANLLRQKISISTVRQSENPQDTQLTLSFVNRKATHVYLNKEGTVVRQDANVSSILPSEMAKQEIGNANDLTKNSKEKKVNEQPATMAEIQDIFYVADHGRPVNDKEFILTSGANEIIEDLVDKPIVDLVSLENSYNNAHIRKQEPTPEESEEAATAFKTTLDRTIKILDERYDTPRSGERLFGVRYDKSVELTFGKDRIKETSELTPYVSFTKYPSEKGQESILTLQFEVDEGKFVGKRTITDTTLSDSDKTVAYLGIEEAHTVRKFMDNVLAYNRYKVNR